MKKTDPYSKWITAGIIALPFYITLSLLLAFTRDGFDWVIRLPRHIMNRLTPPTRKSCTDSLQLLTLSLSWKTANMLKNLHVKLASELKI